MKKILTIAGSDCSGGAGIQADLKTIMAHHMYGMSVITALTAQNTMEVSDIFEITPEFVGKQLDSIFADIMPDSVKIGMVFDPEMAQVIAERLKKYQAKNIVLDPVMVASSGSNLIKEKTITVILEALFPLADLVTPNIPEGEVISNIQIRKDDDMRQAAKYIGESYHTACLLKGGHLLDEANDILFEKGTITKFSARRIANPNTHGTGCTLSSAIACNLALGYALPDCVRNAKRYLTGALNEMLDLGHGRGPLDHGYRIQEDI